MTDNNLEITGPESFLSYAKEDRKKVIDIFKRLKRDNLHPWMDDQHLIAGSEWDLIIRKTIRRCKFFLLCLSHQAVNKRGYIQKEIKEALDVANEMPEGEIFIIPLRLEDCEVPDSLKKWHWIDIYKRNGYSRLKNSLIGRLGDGYEAPTRNGLLKTANLRTHFSDPSDHLLFQHFLDEDSFIYSRLGANRFALSDAKLFVIKNDLPDPFLKLTQIVTRTQKISASIFLAMISKAVRTPENLVKTTTEINDRVIRLETLAGRVAHVARKFWKFVPIYCKHPHIYITDPTDPIIIEDGNKIKLGVMPYMYQ